ncbi:MAG: divergent PAP2 family protein [Treponema sp.]|nr:divergent PAP2 family protein [Treponema sp.]
MDKSLPLISIQIKLFFQSPIFVACFCSWFGAQFIKTAINLCYGKVKSFKQLIELMMVKTGGMPSSHSALVTALATSIGIRNGLNSDIFFVSAVFWAVVIRDAFGVRRSNGMCIKRINELSEDLSKKNLIEPYKPLKEVNGHKPMEVVCGCFLGLFIALGCTLLK